MTVQIRAYDAKLDVLEGERAVVATINTDAVDRYRTVILPKGAKLENYRKNPVVLLQHGPGLFGGGGPPLPIGRNAWIKITNGRMVAKTVFAPADVSEDAERVFRMYQSDFMRAWSVSFDPIEYGKPTPEELRAKPDWAEADLIFREWELLEYSAVVVPGNPQALTEAVSRGIVDSQWLSRFGLAAQREAPPPATPVVPTLPPLEGRTLAQAEAALRARIRSEIRGNFARTVQDARDLARGRV